MSNRDFTWKMIPAAQLQLDAGLAEEWNRLNASRGDLPFLDAKTIAIALECFGSGNERLAVGTMGNRNVAMVVLSPIGRFRWQTFQPSQIPLGAFVADANVEIEELVQGLSRGALDACVQVSLTQIDPRLASRKTDSETTRRSDYIETGWIDIAGTFDDYWGLRGKNLRQNMRKQRNKLDSEGIAGRMLKFQAHEDMADAIVRYGRLESAGWKAASGTAIHADNEQGRFYTEFMKYAASKGEAVVYEYHFGDRPVASNLCVGRAGTLVILKTTYDESVHPFSPAFLLLQDVLEEMHSDGRWKRVEFYGRMMEWHTRWTDNKRTLYHLTCYRWPLLKWAVEKLRDRRQPATELAAAGQPEA